MRDATELSVASLVTEAYFQWRTLLNKNQITQDAIAQLKRVKESYASPELAVRAELMIADAATEIHAARLMVYDAAARLDAVVTVADAKFLAARLKDAPEAKNQIAFADVVIINKARVVAVDTPDNLTARLRGSV